MMLKSRFRSRVCGSMSSRMFSTIARMGDVRKAVTMDFKKAGDYIYAAGLTKNELGASEYFRMLAAEQGAPGHCGGAVPKVDAEKACALYEAMARATGAGLLRSSHTPTLGGLAAARPAAQREAASSQISFSFASAIGHASSMNASKSGGVSTSAVTSVAPPTSTNV